MASHQNHLAPLVREPHLLDLVDDDWAKDSLPDDGEPSCAQEQAATWAGKPPIWP